MFKHQKFGQEIMQSIKKHSAIFPANGLSFLCMVQTRFWFKYTDLIRYFQPNIITLNQVTDYIMITIQMTRKHGNISYQNSETYMLKWFRQPACLHFSKVLDHDSCVLDPRHANSNTTYLISFFRNKIN